jgi:hypothetical protein
MFLRKPGIGLFILSCALILLCLPRFDRRDAGFQSLTTATLGDSDEYVGMVQYFRGEKPAADLHTPYTYRPLVPLLAAALPLEAITAIDVIDLLFLLAGLWILYRLLERLRVDPAARWIGCGLFVVSFPTFYYGTIGNIDPVLICLLAAGVFCILDNRWIVFAAVLVAGAFVKETIVLLIPMLAAYTFFGKKLRSRHGLYLLFITVLFIGAYLAARAVIPTGSSYVWMPSGETFLANASRVRSWISLILTFGIPGVLSLFVFRYRATDWFQTRLPETAMMIAGLFFSLLLFGYSMFSAYADGRFIWTSYPSTIPLAAIVLTELRKAGRKPAV